MTYLILGVLLLLIGYEFVWWNNNSPYSTKIPAYALPAGAVLFIVGLARVLP